LIVGVLLSSACQSLIPSAKGLKTLAWPAVNYQRQDQLEVQWKSKSFSFLLYQQQQGKQLEMIALSLTGQQLFQLSFDGEAVIVNQRIDQMKLLPFEYIVRDLLYATYPNYQTDAKIEQLEKVKIVSIQNQQILNISHHDQLIELRNVQVPYLIVISPVSNTLKNEEDLHAH